MGLTPCPVPVLKFRLLSEPLAEIASAGQKSGGDGGRPGPISEPMGKLKPLLMTFITTVIVLAVINRVQALKNIVYGA